MQQAYPGSHSTPGIPAPSSKLCHDWLRHWRCTNIYLRAAVHRLCQRSPKGLGTNKTESNTASKHARKHEGRPLRIKQISSISIQTILVLFCDGVNDMDGYKRNTRYNWNYLLQLTAIWAPVLVSWQFSETCGITSYGRIRKKNVVNQCMESDPRCVYGDLCLAHFAQFKPGTVNPTLTTLWLKGELQPISVRVRTNTLPETSPLAIQVPLKRKQSKCPPCFPKRRACVPGLCSSKGKLEHTLWCSMLHYVYKDHKNY